MLKGLWGLGGLGTSSQDEGDYDYDSCCGPEGKRVDWGLKGVRILGLGLRVQGLGSSGLSS